MCNEVGIGSTEMFVKVLHLVSAIIWVRVMGNEQEHERKAWGDRNVVLENDNEDIMDRKADEWSNFGKVENRKTAFDYYKKKAMEFHSAWVEKGWR